MNLQMKEAFDFDSPVNMLAVPDYVQKILSLLKLDIELPYIQESDFDYLSQEWSLSQVFKIKKDLS
ncbi:hypothetical protein [Filibacter tadaridae]